MADWRVHALATTPAAPRWQHRWRILALRQFHHLESVPHPAPLACRFRQRRVVRRSATALGNAPSEPMALATTMQDHPLVESSVSWRHVSLLCLPLVDHLTQGRGGDTRQQILVQAAVGPDQLRSLALIFRNEQAESPVDNVVRHPCVCRCRPRSSSPTRAASPQRRISALIGTTAAQRAR